MPSGKSKKPLVLVISIAVVLVIVSAVAAFFLMTDSSGTEPLAEQKNVSVKAVTPNASVGQTAIYIAMPRPFVFSVPGINRDILVQVKIQLLTRSSANEELIRKHIPLVEGTLLKTFSSSTADDLLSLMGKERIREKSLKDLQDIFIQVEGGSLVEQVLFTGYVLQ